MSEEQRKSIRFPVAGGAVAAFSEHNTGEFIKTGPIIDISKAGLALSYIVPKAYKNSSEQVSIIGPRGKIFVGELPCKVIYENDVTNDGSSNFTTKRCGVQFEGLSQQQLSRVQDFIREYGMIAA